MIIILQRILLSKDLTARDRVYTAYSIFQSLFE